MSEEEGEEEEGAIGTQMLPQIHLHTEGLALQKPSFQRTSNPRKPHRVTKLSETIEKYNCSKCKGHKTQSAKARSHYKLLWHNLLWPRQRQRRTVASDALLRSWRENPFESSEGRSLEEGGQAFVCRTRIPQAVQPYDDSPAHFRHLFLRVRLLLLSFYCLRPVGVLAAMNTPEAAIWIAPQRWRRARAKHQNQRCCEERNGDEKREAEDDRRKSPCGGQ